MSYSKDWYALVNLGTCIKGQADRLGIEHDGVPLEGVVVRIANEALSRAAAPEPEWEYRLDTDRTWDGYPLYAIGSSIEEAKANVLKYAPHAKVSFTNPRRRTKGVDPGPWEPLPVEGDDAAL